MTRKRQKKKGESEEVVVMTEQEETALMHYSTVLMVAIGLVLECMRETAVVQRAVRRRKCGTVSLSPRLVIVCVPEPVNACVLAYYVEV